MGSKIRWIIRKQREYKEQIPDMMNPKFTQGSLLPYLGKNYELHILNKNNYDDKIELKNDKFVVKLNSKKNDLNKKDNRIKSLYEDWLYYQANNIFDEKIKHFSWIIDVSPKSIVVKKLKDRWGSATKEGIINLNYNLLKAPDEVID